MQKPERRSPVITRRVFVLTAGAAAAVTAASLRHWLQPVEANGGAPKEAEVVQFSAMGQRGQVVRLAVIVKPDADWKKQLSPEAFEITRRDGTERAYTGQYWNLHDQGLYRCICCDTALFSSDTKYDSGTGWPSFWQPIARENVRESTDLSLGMPRTAVSCRLCDAHLGHVFDDGPRPTGLRYCMNSVALHFAKFA